MNALNFMSQLFALQTENTLLIDLMYVCRSECGGTAA